MFSQVNGERRKHLQGQGLSKFVESHVCWFCLLQKKLSGAFEPIFMAGAVIWTDYSTKVQMQGGCLEVRTMKL